MKIKTKTQLRSLVRKLIKEATGEAGPELVNASNFQHLEVGSNYLVSSGNESVKCSFVGWVDKDGNMTDLEDPNEVDLRFSDVSDGMEWEAYFDGVSYCAGSSGDELYVTEV